jgi:hypothetical protein
VLRLPLGRGATAARLEIQSHLVHGLEVPQGQTVATAHLIAADGTAVTVPLRAGIETAEWSLDRPGARAGHRGLAVARSWSVPEGYQGHTYRGTVDLPRGFRPAQIRLDGGSGPAILVVERLAVDDGVAWPPAPDPGRFRQVTAGLFENTRALPRAFLVRRARQVPAAQLMDQLADLDPVEEALTTDPPPPGVTAIPPVGAPPLPPVRVLAYTPERVAVQADGSEPAVLVLSDTFDRRWTASDNGAPVPIVRADHALRAIFLTPGRHTVELRYRQPNVFVGLGITLATLGALTVAAVIARRRGRVALPPP